ncbi:hypothetical protein Tco_0124492 [Tanacetum coccineum]
MSRKCRSPVCWAKVGDVQLTGGPEIIHETTEKDCANSTTLTSCKRSAKKLRQLAYKLELPEELSNVYNTFHVSNLNKCLSDESLIIPIKELQLNNKLNFVEEPVEIMDREIKQLNILICFQTSLQNPIKSWDEISVRIGDYNNP